jgi:hypothetical protein
MRSISRLPSEKAVRSKGIGNWLREARGPCGAERHASGAELSPRREYAPAVCSDIIKRSDIMKWIGEYIIDDAGQCRWHEGLRIQDEHMKSAYRKNSLIEFMIETSAVMGVKVGIA